MVVLYLAESEIRFLNIVNISVLLPKYFKVEICEETMDQLGEGERNDSSGPQVLDCKCILL